MYVGVGNVIMEGIDSVLAASQHPAIRHPAAAFIIGLCTKGSFPGTATKASCLLTHSFVQCKMPVFHYPLYYTKMLGYVQVNVRLVYSMCI